MTSHTEPYISFRFDQDKTAKMNQWRKKILRRNGGKGTVMNAEEDSDVKATQLMEFIEVTEPSDAVKGHRSFFYMNE